MKAREVAWWGCFLPLALVVQAFVPGVDVLVAGPVVMLQERDYRGLIWLVPLLVMLQEGIGSLAFGGMILWYAAVGALFLAGRWLFAAESLLFAVLLSACLGGVHWGLARVLGALQDVTLDARALLDESLLQALVVLVFWRLAVVTRAWMGMYAVQTS